MSKSNDAKTKALGMAIGTASNRLRKMILFSFVCKLELDVCHQCGRKILSIDDLSIEHKEPWLQADDPIESFFDLDNIAFSHLSCNVAAATRPLKHYHTERERKQAQAKWDRKKHFKLPVEERKRRRREKYERHGY